MGENNLSKSYDIAARPAFHGISPLLAVDPNSICMAVITGCACGVDG